MLSLSSAIDRMHPDQFWRWSRVLLVAAFAFALIIVLLSIWLSTTALVVICAAAAGGIAFSFLAKDELALLCAILAGFVVVVRYKEGFQVEEVLYGLLYMGYLSYWFISRLFFYRDDILRTKVDWALFLFLVYTTLSLGLTPLLEGEMSAAVSEWLSITMIAFYFPIKEVCIRRRERLPQKPILYSLGFVALFIAIRNLNDYKIGLSQADYLWQIASGRVVMNEHVLMFAGLVTLVFLLYAHRWMSRSVLTGLFLLFSASILIAQSRAVWVSFLLGAAVIFLFVDKKRKLHIVVLGLAGVTAVLVIGALVFENFFTVIVGGLTDRFFSLRTAATKDISLINRFIEMKAAWASIKENPIIGHGFGVPIKYYSLVYEATRVNSYVHNGYVGVLYRHGLIGFLLLFYFYFGSLWVFVRMARNRALTQFDQLVAFAAVACLAAEALVGNSANPYAVSDSTFIIGAIAGVAAGSRHQTEQTPGDAREE
jgi:O-antigen ligase